MTPLDERHAKVGYTAESRIDLDKGAEYEVCAMAVWNGLIMYLVFDRTELPNWYPVELFSVSDHTLPPDWSADVYGPREQLQAIWGYREIVLDENHYDALIERDPAAIEIARGYRGRP